MAIDKNSNETLYVIGMIFENVNDTNKPITPINTKT